MVGGRGAGAGGGTGRVGPAGGARGVEPERPGVQRVATGDLPRPGPAPVRGAGAVAARGGGAGAVAGPGGWDAGRARALDAKWMGGRGGCLGAAVAAGVDAAAVRVRPAAPAGFVCADAGVSLRAGGGPVARIVARPVGGEVGAGAQRPLG